MEDITKMLNARLNAQALIGTVMKRIRTAIDEPQSTDLKLMQMLVNQLVSAKDSFNVEHYAVTDQLDPDSTDAIDLHKHADDLETEVGELYSEGASWIALNAVSGQTIKINEFKTTADRKAGSGGANPTETGEISETPEPAESEASSQVIEPANNDGVEDITEDTDEKAKEKDSGRRKDGRRGSEKSNGKERNTRDDRFKSEFQKNTSKTLYEIRDLLSYQSNELASLQRQCNDKEGSIRFLQKQREGERNDFVNHINILEHELNVFRRRASSTPAQGTCDKGVTFDEEFSKVKNASVVNENDIVKPKLQSVVTSVAGDTGQSRAGSRVNQAPSLYNYSVYPPPVEEDIDLSDKSCVLSKLISQNNSLVQSFIDDNKTYRSETYDAREIPRTKLGTFSGDPLEFWLFIKNFDDLVGNSSLKESKKLNVLVHHVDDDVKKLISSCQMIDPGAGYTKARALLKAKFGSPFLISQAWKKKLCKYPRVLSSELLASFSEDLSCCCDTIKEMKYTAQMENVDTISEISSRLPNYLRSKWRRIHRQALLKGKIGTLDELRTLVEDAADEANCPFYNDARLDKMMSQDKPQPSFAGTDKGEVSKVNHYKPSKKAAVYSIVRDGRILSSGDEDTEEFDRQIVIMASEFSRKKKCQHCESDEHYTSKCSKYLELEPSERLVVARKKKLCLLCLGPDHFISKCKQTWKCQEKGCLFKHHNSLHGAFQLPERTNATVKLTEVTSGDILEQENPGAEIHVTTICKEIDVFKTITVRFASLPMTPIIAQGSSGTAASYGLLDTASNTTIVTAKFIRAIGAKKKGSAKLTINTVTGKHVRSGSVYDFEIKGVDGEGFMPVFDAVALDELPISTEHIITAQDVTDWPYLVEVGLPEVEVRHVDILIGQDNAHLLKPGARIDGPRMRDPYAVETPLGWTVYGFRGASSCVQDRVAEVNALIVLAADVRPNLEEMVTRFWTVDQVPQIERMSPAELSVINYWDANIKLVDGVMFIPIPFKKRPPDFPNNREAVKQRLESLGRRLKKDPNLLKMYVDAMEVNFEMGYAKKVTNIPEPGKSWCMTQLPVEHRRKPGVARPVFNASFRFKNRCLNEEAHQGPDQNNRLVDVLINFRIYEFAMTCDIQAMFNRIKVPIALLLGLRRVLSQVNFNLTKVAANCVEVLEAVPEADRAVKVVDMNLAGGQPVAQYSLGQRWMSQDDFFTFIVEFLEDPETRRQLLSTMSTLFDPLGLCTPFLVPAKRMFQELSRRGLAWDDPLLEDIKRQWKKWVNASKDLEDYRVPRWVGFHEGDVRAQLVHFSDASEIAYGSVTYFCTVASDGMIVDSRILMSRVKLAPMKTQSIPRLELCGALVAVQCEEAAVSYLDLDLLPSSFWTDSTLVLRYVTSHPSQFKTFIANRVSAILQVTSSEQWNFVPGTENPADTLSRGATARELVDDRRWVYGPDFLRQKRSQWPSQPDFLDVDLPPEEVKRERDIYVAATTEPEKPLAVTKNEQVEEISSKNWLYQQIKSKSGWIEMVRHVAWLLRAAERFKIKDADGEKKFASNQLEVRDLKAAENKIFGVAQEIFLTKERAENPTFKKLFPRMRDNLCCVGGRLERARLDQEFIHPVILPPSNHITDTFIRYCHEEVYHSGVERTMMRSRKSAWILTGRKAIEQVLKDCSLCNRFKKKPMSQFMAPLPSFRLTPGVRPFTNVGLDYFGPFMVKVGRSEVKRFACVIVCSATRAVHIEPAVDMSTTGFINAFSRFISRRGKPKNVLSDNGTNFVGAKAVLDKETVFWNTENAQRFCTDRGIAWRFNPPAASHFGGFWERQIRDIRSLAMCLFKGVSLTEDVLHTVLCMVEQMMNSRPLTKLTDDPEDMEPLTPNHLLLMENVDSLTGVFFDKDVLARSWRKSQKLADEFWQRWTYQYVTELQKRTKWLDEQRNLKQGDLVLITSNLQPRMHWPLGLVTKTFAGSDGLVRSAEVRTQTGIYCRPIAKLVLLEADLVVG